MMKIIQISVFTSEWFDEIRQLNAAPITDEKIRNTIKLYKEKAIVDSHPDRVTTSQGNGDEKREGEGLDSKATQRNLVHATITLIRVFTRN